MRSKRHHVGRLDARLRDRLGARGSLPMISIRDLARSTPRGPAQTNSWSSTTNTRIQCAASRSWLGLDWRFERYPRAHHEPAVITRIPGQCAPDLLETCMQVTQPEVGGTRRQCTEHHGCSAQAVVFDRERRGPAVKAKVECHGVGVGMPLDVCQGLASHRAEHLGNFNRNPALMPANH